MHNGPARNGGDVERADLSIDRIPARVAGSFCAIIGKLRRKAIYSSSFILISFLAEDLHIRVLFLKTCPNQPLNIFSEIGLGKGGEEMRKQKAIRARKIRIVISTNEHA